MKKFNLIVFLICFLSSFVFGQNQHEYIFKTTGTSDATMSMSFNNGQSTSLGCPEVSIVSFAHALSTVTFSCPSCEYAEPPKWYSDNWGLGTLEQMGVIIPIQVNIYWTPFFSAMNAREYRPGGGYLPDINLLPDNTTRAIDIEDS